MLNPHAMDAAPEMKKEQKSSHPYGIDHIKIENPEYMDEVPEHLRNKDLPGFPSTIVAVGRPGSGKSNVLMNLLTRPDFWLHFFDKIYLLGPTVKSDKLFKKIKVPDEQIVTDPDEFIPKLVEWTTTQVDAVKNDAKNAPKCLFIFEDITSYRYSVQQNPNFTKCFTTIRHHKSTAYANIHKYAALERTSRMSCMHIIVFPVNLTDVDQLYKDYGTHDFDKNDFRYVCEYAWTKDAENEKPFLYINLYADDKERFRKCFTKIIDVSKFKGIAKRKKLEEKKKMGDSLLGSKRKREDEDPTSNKRPHEGAGDMTKLAPEQMKTLSEENLQNEDGPFKKGITAETNVFAYLR